MPRVLLIGQAPGPNSDPDDPLRGPCGGRLADLCGIDVEAFLARFDRVNLIYRFPGKRGKGDAFPIDKARRSAVTMALRGDLSGRRVVFLGENVLRAFIPLARILPPLSWVPYHLQEIAVCPHPSGVNRWWNDEKNVRRARRFWRALERETR